MTKPELVNRIAEKTGLDKKHASNVIAALITTITDELKAGEKIAIPNIGTFEVRERAARQGRNPRTGEAVEIAAKRVPAFKPSKVLKDAIQ